MTPIAHIAELWRYPVKGMRGERVNTLDLLIDGIAHDRRFAFESSAAPRGKPLLSGSERAQMLLSTATVRNGITCVRTPTGGEFDIDSPALLSALALNPGTLRLVHSQRPLTDVRPVALLSTQTTAQLGRELAEAVDPRRFRANIVLSFDTSSENSPENHLPGLTLRLGPTATLAVTERIPRCRIVTLSPDTAQPYPALMKHLDRRHSGRIGVYAITLKPGPLHVGDPVCVSP